MSHETRYAAFVEAFTDLEPDDDVVAHFVWCDVEPCTCAARPPYLGPQIFELGCTPEEALAWMLACEGRATT